MVATIPQYAFPDRYNENYLVLLVRDPHCIFGYWELSEDQMDLVARECCCSWGDVPLVLRVYDFTGLAVGGREGHGYFDIDVHPLANNYYVQEVNANHSYCVDLGIITAEGRFVTLLRSNVVQTSRDSMADGSGVVMADLLDRLIFEKEAQPNQDWPEENFSSEGVYINSRKNSEPEKGEGK